jgi:hypothetical protein
MKDNPFHEDAQDFRARKLYEILYEKKDVTSLDINFLEFLFKDTDSPTLIKLIRDIKKFRKITVKDIVNKRDLEKWKKPKSK